jgi:muramidase (phage lysozyme)
MASGKNSAALLAVVGAGLLLLGSGVYANTGTAASSGGSTVPTVAGYLTDGDGNLVYDSNGNPIPIDASGNIIPTDSSGDPIPTAAAPSAPSIDLDTQLAALMATIRQYESGNNYLMLYGNTVSTYPQTDHPYFLGWPGVVLPPNTCTAAGFKPGCITTAAGGYQFISTTWRKYQNPGSDFSPASQDAAAANLLTALGAVASLQAGNVQAAFQQASTQWASMPYSSSGQPKQTLATVMTSFQNFGGVVT